jgi:hypothetical protein
MDFHRRLAHFLVTGMEQLWTIHMRSCRTNGSSAVLREVNARGGVFHRPEGDERDFAFGIEHLGALAFVPGAGWDANGHFFPRNVPRYPIGSGGHFCKLLAGDKLESRREKRPEKPRNLGLFGTWPEAARGRETSR